MTTSAHGAWEQTLGMLHSFDQETHTELCQGLDKGVQARRLPKWQWCAKQDPPPTGVPDAMKEG